MKPRIVIAGGSGFVGRALVAAAQDRYETVVLSRRSGPGALAWDGKTVGDWAKAVDGAAAVVNLAGEPVTLRWTDENRRRILDSRVESTRAIGQAILAATTPPPVWVNASAVGFYGDTGDRAVHEGDPAGTGFLGETCVAWEAAATGFSLPSTRLVMPRIGVVLGRDGGAFPLLLKTTKLFVGGAVGSGRQWMPWIHLDDLVQMFLWAIESDLVGPFNACAPEPARNADVMATLRKVVGRPWSPPAPAFALGLMSAVTGMETAPALLSSRVVPVVAGARHFPWRFSELEEALRDLVS